MSEFEENGSVELLLPVFNERERLDRVLEEVHAWSQSHSFVRVVFVDDCSNDGSRELLQRWIDAHPNGNIRLHCCAKRRGKGGALRDAVRCATSTFVCFTDGDLAYSLEHVDRLIEALQHFDVVIGSRALASQKQINIHLKRKVLGAVFNYFVRVYLDLPFRDTQAGLKGFRTPVAKELFEQCHHEGFAFDAELLYLARLQGHRVGEIPAYVSARHSYKVSSLRMRSDPWKMFYAVLRMRWDHRDRR